MSDLAKVPGELSLTVEQIGQFVDKPLRQLPAEWRPVVWDFWSQWSHLLPNQLALASRLRHWIVEQELTLDEAREVFRTVNRPHKMGEMKFASDLLATLAELVGSIVTARKEREQWREAKERSQREKSEALPADAVRQLLAGIGRPVE